MAAHPHNPQTDLLRICFAKVLTRLRRRAGFTQAKLAAEIGASQSGVGQWEEGGALPSMGSFWLVAAALNCTPSQILAQIEQEMEHVRRRMQESTHHSAPRKSAGNGHSSRA